jgi:hypothetical protein
MFRFEQSTMELTVSEEARAETAKRAIILMVAIRQEEADMLVDDLLLLGLRRFCEGNASVSLFGLQCT